MSQSTEKYEKLKQYFQTQDVSNNKLRKFAFLSIVVSSVTVLISVIGMIYFYHLSSVNTYVLDKDGNIASAFKEDLSGQKEVEIDNHIKMIYGSFFTYNASNYKKQVEKGLNLMGEQGRLLYQTYSQNNWYNMVVQNSLDVTGVVDSIKINSAVKPYQFESYGRQFIKRFNVVEVRALNTRGVIYDVSRVKEKNPHGLRAELNITDNRTLRADSVRQQQNP